MSGKGSYDDDYVAKLLVEDAKNLSTRYSSSVPSRSSKLRPNTRFLSNIIREVDSHNTSLKHREESEARARLKRLQGAEERGLRDNVKHEKRSSHKRRKIHHDDQTARRHHKHHDKRIEPKSSRSYHTNDEDHAQRQRKEAKHLRDDHKDNTRSRASHHSRGRSESEEAMTIKSVSQADAATVARAKGRTNISETPDDDESDELETFLNPRIATKPQAIVRGRGAGTIRSYIDDHFSPNYDPNQDTGPASDHLSDPDDWAMALEVARDRAMWKKKQADRLREAGWDDRQISKWERGHLDKSRSAHDQQSFEWSKKGETRQWDIGKSS